MRNILEPLYERYHVDLVLQGHDHLYDRTHKIFQGKRVPNSKPGTVYAISVSGPKRYAVTPRFASLMSQKKSHTQGYQVISIEKDLLSF
jgi:acid phosphatase type 7